MWYTNIHSTQKLRQCTQKMHNNHVIQVGMVYEYLPGDLSFRPGDFPRLFFRPGNMANKSKINSMTNNTCSNKALDSNSLRSSSTSNSNWIKLARSSPTSDWIKLNRTRYTTAPSNKTRYTLTRYVLESTRQHLIHKWPPLATFLNRQHLNRTCWVN